MSQRDSLASELLFIGTRGHVLAVDKQDGLIVWKTSLPKTGHEPVVMLVEDGRLFCGTRGKVFALDALNGGILWENELPGLGRGIVSLATLRQAGDDVPVLAADAAAKAQAAATAGTGVVT